MRLLRWLWSLLTARRERPVPIRPRPGDPEFFCPDTCGHCTCLRDHKPCPGCPCVKEQP